MLQRDDMRANRWIGLAVVAAALGLHTPDADAGLRITFTTSPAGGPYAPNHVVAVWVETQAGAFVKTIGRWSAARTSSLQTWIGKAGAGDADAVSGATQTVQPDTLTIMEWDLTDRQGNVIPDGTYTVRMELADFNPGQGTPNLGTFSFIKGDAPQTQTALTNGGFSNVSIEYAPPPAAACNNGVVDPGETCDPMITSGTGACVADCAATGDACMINELVGSAASCNAECQVTTVTACTAGDGCCPDGCAGMDDDCDGGNGGGTSDLGGGCSSTGSGGALLALFALGFVIVGTRRRR